MSIKILAIGDIVGTESVKYFISEIFNLRRSYKADLIVVNGENASENNGIDSKTATEILNSGADIITTGNHIWKHRSIRNFIDDNERLLRPANFPGNAPGNGYVITEVNGYRVLVINLLGVVYLESLNSPFEAADKILADNRGKFDFAIVDIHAEATSEKLAMAHYLDRGGRSGIRETAAVWGTHTHVQTADEQILPNGTGYITDLGMCGHINSILGVKVECVLDKFILKMPVKFESATGKITGHGVLFEIDPSSCQTTKIESIKF